MDVSPVHRLPPGVARVRSADRSPSGGAKQAQPGTEKVSELLAAVLADGMTGLLNMWREKARARRFSRGKNPLVPCAVRGGPGVGPGTWRQGALKLDKDAVHWQARTAKQQLTLERGRVRLLAERRPTARESWFVNGDMLILGLHSELGRMDLALPPADVPRVRSALGLPELSADPEGDS